MVQPPYPLTCLKAAPHMCWEVCSCFTASVLLLFAGSESSSGSSNSGHRTSLLKAGARAEVAASLNTFSEEFLTWASAGGGEDLEKKLLADVGARGTESSCKSLFVTALLDELVAKGHRTLVFSQSRVMLDILQVCGALCEASRYCQL